jgi:hypothetical protein
MAVSVKLAFALASVALAARNTKQGLVQPLKDTSHNLRHTKKAPKCRQASYNCGHETTEFECCGDLECHPISESKRFCRAPPVAEGQSTEIVQEGPNDWLANFASVKAVKAKQHKTEGTDPYALPRECLETTQLLGAADRKSNTQFPDHDYKYKVPKALEYPQDAEAHYQEVLKATAPFRGKQVHQWIGWCVARRT